MATLADRAVDLGLLLTDWFDTSQGHPGIEQKGTINPRAQDWKSRYGTDGKQIEYNPRNWAGAHAPAANIGAPIVVYKVFETLGLPIEPTANDLSDLDLIDGLTRYVMDQAGRLRITADSVLGQPRGSDVTTTTPPTIMPTVPAPPVVATPPVVVSPAISSNVAAASTAQVTSPAPPSAPVFDFSQLGTVIAQSVATELSTTFAALLQAELARLLPKQDTSATTTTSGVKTPRGRKPKK